LFIKEGTDGQGICHFQCLKRKQTKKEIEKVNPLKFFAKKSTTRFTFYPEDAE